MDFLDPQKQKRHAVVLSIGYVLMGIMLILATTILLYQSYGYWVDKDGRVIQNGLLFVSSHPEGADAYVNGRKYKDNTNTKMRLPSGQYVVELRREGYQTWKRVMTVEGGGVERFDYPFLFPIQLNTTVVKQYSDAPSLSTESPDRRWLLLATSKQNTFDLYDLNSKEPIPRTLTIANDILAAGSTTSGWQLVDWAGDNRHVLLRRLYKLSDKSGREYVMLDTENPTLSQNLSVALGFTPAAINLRGRAFDKYYAFDKANAQLFTASLGQAAPQLYASNVLAFASEGDVVVYATSEGAPDGKVLVKVRKGAELPLTVRQVPAGTNILLEMAVYNHSLFLAAGATSENRVFLYRDPVDKLKDEPSQPLAPIQILKVFGPSSISFSANKRFLIAENSDLFAVYDAETDRSYAYQAKVPLDKPQTRATWMDGFRLSYVSGGKVVVFDFDGINMTTLSPASPNYLPIFDRSYRYMYTLDTGNNLTRVPLLTTEDL